MNDHVLLLIAVTATTINAVASIARTVWHWEKRREVRARQSSCRDHHAARIENKLWEGSRNSDDSRLDGPL